MTREIHAPLSKDIISTLKSGDIVHISGVIYAARDAAHKRFMKMLDEGTPLPFDVKNQIIYYVGPSPSPEGKPIGSCGPTTSGRMDAYTPRILDMGLSGMIGKGHRSAEVIESIVKNNAIYFGAIGGVGALLSRSVVSQEIICFPELGAEAVRKLTVKNFPVIVVIDSKGNNLYESGKLKYRIEDL